MNHFLKAFSLLAFIAFFASCKDDDEATVAPPRDYAVQYATEKAQIEEYLKTHYFTVNENYDVTFDTLLPTSPQQSIWEQTQFPLQNKAVTLNDVDYTVYYLKFYEGDGKAPTRADNAVVQYKGSLLDGTVFEDMPYPQSSSALYDKIEGWQEIIPLFKDGVLVPDTPEQDPAQYQGFGAGVMFLPSDFGYYNIYQGTIPSYSPLIFEFKLLSVTYTDLDGDGILNKDETVPGVDILEYDTDGDDIPNFLDDDDDGDGYTTLTELEKYNYIDPANPVPFVPAQYYSFNDAAMLPCTPNGPKPYLDPTCQPVR